LGTSEVAVVCLLLESAPQLSAWAAVRVGAPSIGLKGKPLRPRCAGSPALRGRSGLRIAQGTALSRLKLTSHTESLFSFHHREGQWEKWRPAIRSRRASCPISLPKSTREY
jgi:hypothetical protein